MQPAENGKLEDGADEYRSKLVIFLCGGFMRKRRYVVS
jgi:hypothetical protein